MSKVAIITEQQSQELASAQCVDGCFFNPIQDANNDWVISEEEINQSDLDWLKKLELIEFKSKENVSLH